MIFVNHGRQLRASQWISAVDKYNKETPAHLHIHWAGSTEAEHVRESEGRRYLTNTVAYIHIVKKNDTYMEWSIVSLSGKGPGVQSGQVLQDSLGYIEAEPQARLRYHERG